MLNQIGPRRIQVVPGPHKGSSLRRYLTGLDAIEHPAKGCNSITLSPCNLVEPDPCRQIRQEDRDEIAHLLAYGFRVHFVDEISWVRPGEGDAGLSQ